MISEHPLLNEEDASAITGFAVPTLRKRRWQGLPPRFLKIGSLIRYTREDIDKFLISCIRNSTSDTGNK